MRPILACAALILFSLVLSAWCAFIVLEALRPVAVAVSKTLNAK